MCKQGGGTSAEKVSKKKDPNKPEGWFKKFLKIKNTTTSP